MEQCRSDEAPTRLENHPGLRTSTRNELPGAVPVYKTVDPFADPNCPDRTAGKCQSGVAGVICRRSFLTQYRRRHGKH